MAKNLVLKIGLETLMTVMYCLSAVLTHVKQTLFYKTFQTCIITSAGFRIPFAIKMLLASH